MAIVRKTLDAKKPTGLSEATKRRLDAMTDAETEANALADPDNPPLAPEEEARFVTALLARRAREATGLSQTAFAKRFGLKVGAVRDWEQGRCAADAAARSLLTIIKNDPDAARRALETA